MMEHEDMVEADFYAHAGLEHQFDFVPKAGGEYTKFKSILLFPTATNVRQHPKVVTGYGRKLHKKEVCEAARSPHPRAWANRPRGRQGRGAH